MRVRAPIRVRPARLASFFAFAELDWIREALYFIIGIRQILAPVNQDRSQVRSPLLVASVTSDLIFQPILDFPGFL